MRTILLSNAGFLLICSGQAEAQLWDGACSLALTLTFDTPVRSTGSAPDYTMTVTAGPSSDFDPDRAGRQPCFVTTFGAPTRLGQIQSR